MSIVRYLKSEYNISVSPGKKTRCPICNSTSKTLSVRKRDDLAKCFRCQHFVMEVGGRILDSNKKEQRA